MIFTIFKSQGHAKFVLFNIADCGLSVVVILISIEVLLIEIMSEMIMIVTVWYDRDLIVITMIISFIIQL